jgi:AcrR family transcriptional regulator
MPKRSREYMDNQRLRFCKAAMACFSRKGVAASNLTDICEEAQLSMGALYKHFTSRDDLLAAVLQLRSERRNSLLHGDSWSELRTAIVAYWQELQELPFWREFQGITDWNEELRSARVAQAQIVLKQIREQLERFSNRAEIEPPFDLERTAQLVSIIFDGSIIGIRSTGDLHIMLDDLTDYLDLAVGARPCSAATPSGAVSVGVPVPQSV